MDLLVSCAWIAIEIPSLLLFENAFLERRYPRRKALWMLLGYYLFSLCVDLGFPVALPIETQKLVNISASVAFALLLFGGPWYSRAAAALNGYFFLAALDVIIIYGAAALLGLSLSELIWNKPLYIAVGTADKLLCFALFWGVWRLLHRRARQTRNLHRLLFASLVSLASTLGLLRLYLNSQTQVDFSLTVVGFGALLLMANAVLFYLMSSLDHTAAAEKELALLNQSKALQTESYRALEKSYRAQRAATHEFKHQLQLIGDLMRDGHGDEALRYIDELQGRQSSRILAANTGSTIVDAILNEKYQRARELKIDVRYSVSDLSALAVDTDALVVLLSNLLDNAIEGCARLAGERVLECSLILEDSLLLSVRNTAPPVEIVDGHIETTKEPKAEHGFGLGTVGRIVRQLSGELAMDYTAPWFQITVELPNA